MENRGEYAKSNRAERSVIGPAKTFIMAPTTAATAVAGSSTSIVLETRVPIVIGVQPDLENTLEKRMYVISWF